MLSIILLGLLTAAHGAPAPPTATLGRTRIIGSQVANVEFFGGTFFFRCISHIDDFTLLSG